MACSIVFFGDGSLPLHPAYPRILQARKDDSLLSLFLNRARLALQHEIYNLPVPDRKGIPDLAELEALIRQPGDTTPDHQYLAPPMLVIIQLGQFISWYESRPEVPYPNADSAIIVGLCIGQISAAAVSQAHSLTELLPRAVESVRVAFRTGFVATTVRDELEPQSNPQDSWAMTISREGGLTEDNLLETIHLETGISKRKSAYVSALFPKALTLQGPPSTLDSIDGWLSNNRTEPSISCRRIPVYTPYHAPHLYSDHHIQWILNGDGPSHNVYRESHWTGLSPKLVSPVTGHTYSAPNSRELLESILHDVLREPIQWDSMAAGCVSHIAASNTLSWIVRPFGPTLVAKSLVSALRVQDIVEISLDDSFGSINPPQPGTVTKAPLAIVGMAGRFPEAMNHDELWELLEKGIDCHTVIPIDRFDPDLYVARDGRAKNATGTPYGCFMKKPGLFDARFFNMSPREAEQTDPQQRLILTTAHEALEMSGFVPNRTPSSQLDRVGTYYGQTADDYREINASQDIQTYYVTGNDRAFGPGRINYHFKFAGPSVCIDTACSSSAVSLNVACTALWANDCDTAVVGGMLLMTSPDSFCGLSRAHFVNDTGNCKTYDDNADGYCRGEAVATVIVKRLSDAQADNDKVLAVILAAGTNHSAASISLTHPHGPTQEVLYKKLLNQAGLQPFDIDYVEMHGTGTQAGDAVEMGSVSNVFAPASPARPADRPLFVGSVKANVGHGESVSGVTALIKTLLVLREKRIPPHVGIKSGIMNRTFPNLNQRNIKIALDGVPMQFPCQQGRKRHALVNNFGAAGGNTAFLLEEAPETADTGVIDTRTHHIISVTAKTTASIKNNIHRLITYIEKESGISLSDLSYTTTARRTQFPLRISVIASSLAELKNGLVSAMAKENFRPSIKVSNIILTFTGQGSLYLPLAGNLFESSKQFRSDLLRFNQVCEDQGFPSFLPVIDGSASDLDTLTPTQTQLALTAVQMSLYRLWSSWGVVPTAVIGHSLGEYASLFACGMTSANDTLHLVGSRARLLEQRCTQKTHCMLSVRSVIGELKELIGARFKDLEVACINSPEDVVLSGPADITHEVYKHIKSLGLKCIILDTPFAFHSSQVDPILDEFESAARSVKFAKPRIPLISPLLGTVIDQPGVVGPSYLRRHAREVVDFKAALQRAESEGLATKEAVWLEIGPNPVCLAMAQSTLGSQARGMPSLRRHENAWTTSAKTLSFLHDTGIDLNWNEYHRDFETGQNLLHIPTYSFDEKNYWIEYKTDWALNKGSAIVSPNARIETEPTMITTSVHKLFSKEVKGNNAFLVFETDLSEPNIHAMISGHRINGLALCPAGVYADMALTVADYIRKELQVKVVTTGINVTEMEVYGPVVVPVPRAISPQLFHITATANLDYGTVNIIFGSYSPQTKTTNPNAKCEIQYGDENRWLRDWSASSYLVQKRIEDLECGVRNGTIDRISKKVVYQLFSALVVYGPVYKGMQEVLINSDEMEGTASLRFYEGSDVGNFFASPHWLDNLAQLAGFMMNGIGNVDSRVIVYITHGWESCRISLPIDSTKPYRVHIKMQPLDQSIFAGNVSIFQGDRMVGLVGQLKFQRMSRSLLDTMLSPQSAGKTVGSRTHQNALPTPPIRAPQVPAEPPPRPCPTALDSESQDSPIAQILEYIAEEIGVSIADLTDDTDFDELGVDSLMSLTISSRVRETLHLDLPPSLFQEFQTVGDLRRSLSDSSSTSDQDSRYTIDPTPTESYSQFPMVVSESDNSVMSGLVDVLHNTVAEQIGIDADDLLATDDLTTLGVDSLMSLSIIAALRERLGVDIPSNALEESFSLSGIKEVLNLTAGKTSRPQPKPKAKERSSKVLLLQGNPNHASKPLFLFPDGSGSATSYAALPEISPNTCVFAIDSPFLKRPAEYTCSLEEASRLMADEVRSKQPQGPYILGGWSAGGMYAYEAARYLMETGDTVEKLILIDSPCRVKYGPMPKDVLEYISKSGVISGKTSGTAPQWLVDHFRGTIRAVKDYAPIAFKPSESPETFLIWATKGVFEDWPKAELAGLDLTDAVASWLLKPKADPGSQGWEQLLSPKKISCISVEGNHFSMVHPPHCKSLSRAIADALDDDSKKRLGGWRRA